MTVNKAIIVGRLGQDPEVRFRQDGMAIANLTLATSERRRDKNTGEQIEETEWHRIVLFGKTAEVAQEYLRKGGLVYVEGKIKTRKWTDREGIDRYTTEIVGDAMRMLGGRNDGYGYGQGQQQGYAQPQQQQRQRPPQQQRPQQQQGYPQQQGHPQQNQYAQASGGGLGHQQGYPQGHQQGLADMDDDVPF